MSQALGHETAYRLEKELSGHILQACYWQEGIIAVRVYGFAHRGLFKRLRQEGFEVDNILSTEYSENWPPHFDESGICLMLKERES